MTAIDGVAPAPDSAAAGGDPTLSGHVIVYGVRGVGLRTVEHLHAAKIDTVVVAAGPDDTDPVTDALLASWGVPQVTGRTREALAAARLDTAAAVICVPDDDLRAMETALLVRRIRPDVRLVVRMGNSAVGRALAEVRRRGQRARRRRARRTRGRRGVPGHPAPPDGAGRADLLRRGPDRRPGGHPSRALRRAGADRA